MSLVEQKISGYVPSQLPRIIRAEGPEFVSFCKAYYQFLEQEGGVTAEGRAISEYRDIDTTLDQFLDHWIKKYMSGVPVSILGNIRVLQKHIKELFSSKGTIQGLKLLFQLLYGEEVTVYYPGQDILKPSDGTWNQPSYVEITSAVNNVLLIGQVITGRESNATAIVEDFQTRFVNGKAINLLYLSNQRGIFNTGEILLNAITSNTLECPVIIGSLTDIEINESGFNYKVGDVLDIVGGSGVSGKAVVSHVSPRTGAVTFTIQDGGSGYANNNEFAPSIVDVAPVDFTNPGVGATFQVGRISNTHNITTPVDIIEPYGDVVLGSTDYGFPPLSNSNFNTPLNQALNVQDITVGTIISLTAINPGTGYNGPITVNVHNDVIGGLRITDPDRVGFEGLNANVVGAATAGNGAIDAVQVLDSGFGYLAGDVVQLENANNDFIAGGVVQLGHAGHSQGFWSDTKSFLNADKYIEDSHYYQDYSYEVQASISYDKYSTLLKNFWHPAGTISFGKVVIFNEDDAGSSVADLRIQNVFETTFIHDFDVLQPTAFLTSTSYLTTIGTTYFTEYPTNTSRGTQTRVLSGLQEQLVNGTFLIDLSNWTTVSGNVMWDASESMALGNSSSSGFAAQGISANVGGTYWISFDFTETDGGDFKAWASTTTNTSDQVAALSTETIPGHYGFSFVASEPVMYVIVAGSTGGIKIDNVSVKQLPIANAITQAVTSRSTATVYGTAVSTSRTTTSVFNTAYVTAFNTNAFTASAFATTRATVGATATTFITNFNTSKLTNLATTTTFETAKAASRSTSSVYDTTFDTTITTSRITSTTGATSYATTFQTATVYSTIYDTAFATNLATTTTTNYDTTTGTSKTTTTVYNTTYGTTFDTLTPTSYATATQFATSRTTNYTTNYLTTFITNFATTFGTTIATTFVTNPSVQTATNFATTRNTDTSLTTNFVTTYDTTQSTNVATSRSTNFLTATSASTSRTTTYVTSFVSTFDTTKTTAFATSRTTTYATAASRATQTFISTSAATATSINTTRTTNTSRLTIQCVAADSYLSDTIQARDVVRGMIFTTWTPTEGFQEHQVENVGKINTVPAVRLVTASNASLVTSDTTPFNLKSATKDLEEGHWKWAPEMLGEEVLVTRDGQEAIWEEVVQVIVEGLKEIVPISFGGRSFAAGESKDVLLFSHNMAKPSQTEVTTTFLTTTAYASIFNTSTVYFSFFNTTTAYTSQTARTTTYDTSKTTAFATSIATSGSTSRTTTFVTNFNTTTTFVTNFVSTYNTAFATNTSTSRVTSFATVTAYDTIFNTTTNFSSTVTRNTTYDTSQLTSGSTSQTTGAPASRVTTYLTTFNTNTTILTESPTIGQTTIATNTTTNTAYLTAFNTSRTTSTTTTFDTTLATNRNTTGQTTTTFDTTIATAKPTSTAFNTSYATNFSTQIATTTSFLTNLATNFVTSTQYTTNYDTSLLTQKSTNTAFVTTFDTSTTKLTTVGTARTTVIATNLATTTTFNTTFDTTGATTTSFGTAIVTTFVVIPTTFQTVYATNTLYPTTYPTHIVTDAMTDTVVDTEYPTSRVTSIATGTSLLPPQ